ncbi:MAG TPA: hypothetical protein VMS08_01015, partial [Candidatus Saccharimonadia bacterium]|nr:hypothetical protein [Candidatus Saccharimonadia bacterium]
GAMRLRAKNSELLLVVRAETKKNNRGTIVGRETIQRDWSRFTRFWRGGYIFHLAPVPPRFYPNEALIQRNGLPH